MTSFDIENWIRKPQYEFFKSYEDPFFNVTATIDVSNLLSFCKKNELSFSLACIFVAIKSINEIPEFKLRIFNEAVYLFETVGIGSTIFNDDTTFSFCYFENQKNIFDFDKEGKLIIENHKNGIFFEPRENAIGLVHCSILPWVSFTGIKHARKGDEGSLGIPKIMFGKYFKENNCEKIPFSVEVNHALMDGYHVGVLFEKMQHYINQL